MTARSNPPSQYQEHRANREFNVTIRNLLADMGDRTVQVWWLRLQVTKLEILLPMCGNSVPTDIKRKRVEAIKAEVDRKTDGPRLTVLKGGKR
jgi:hypothetical protein